MIEDFLIDHICKLENENKYLLNEWIKWYNKFFKILIKNYFVIITNKNKWIKWLFSLYINHC